MQTAAPNTSARTLTVVTPENVTVTYQLAGVVTRTGALIIDMLIQGLLILCLSIVIDFFRNVGFGVDHLASFFGFIASFCVMFVYSIFFEMVWGGRTPGKRVFGLRVIRDGGYPINITASCIRNVLRFADLGAIILPSGPPQVLWGAPGFIIVFLSPQYKRIGDYAAGTLVIHERSASALELGENTRTLSPAAESMMPHIKNIDRLSRTNYRAIRRVLARRSKLEPAVLASISEYVARPILDKLEITFHPAYQMQYTDILEAIEQRYAEEYGIL
jgi:uncharacterized RDD family membrane protein YckC